MPKYLMVSLITGTRDGVDWPKPGEVVDLPKDEGSALVAAGLASEGLPKVETATFPTGRRKA